MTDKIILDACCGSKMFWFDKSEPRTIFIDKRKEEMTLCDGRKLEIKPDVVADFRSLPFPDETFYHVVFDPPHLCHAGAGSWIRAKYGCLDPDTWKSDIKKGFEECMRVLKPHGTLIFKWSEDQIKVSDVLDAIGTQPLYGSRNGKSGKSIWLAFVKEETR